MIRLDDPSYADTEMAADWPPKDWPPRRTDWPVPPYGLGAIREIAEDDDPRPIPGAGPVAWLVLGVVAMLAAAAGWHIVARWLA